MLVNEQLEFVKWNLCAEKHKQFSVQNSTKLKWTGTEVELVELLYALHTDGNFNNGNISLKDLFDVFGELFDFEVKNFSRTFTDIKNRTKGDRTVYIDKLKSGLLQKFYNAEEIRFKRK